MTDTFDHRWEQFTISEEHLGFSHGWRDREADGVIAHHSFTAFKLGEHDLTAHFFYRVHEIDPQHWISFGVADDSGVNTYTRDNGRLLPGQDNPAQRKVAFPVNGFPTAAWHLILDRLDLKGESSFVYASITEGDVTLQQAARMEVVGKDEIQVDLNGATKSLWRAREFVNNSAARSFWMNDDGIVEVCDWNGPVSYLVKSREDAVAGLDDSLLTYATEH